MMTASGPPRLNEHLTGICSLSMGQSRIKMTIVPAAGSMSVTAMFQQLGSGVPVNPFAKSELLY